MTRVIDVHAHLLPRSAIAAAESGGEWFGSSIEDDDMGRPVIITGERREGMGGKAHYESMERRIERMDEDGVDMQLLSLNPIFFRHYIGADDGAAASVAVNDEIAGFIEQWPTRFGGYGALPMQDPDRAIAELERVMAIDGMIGACVGTHVDGANWDEPHLFPVLEAAQELGALMFFHPSDRRLEKHLPRYHLHNSIANPTETTIAIASIVHGGILDKLPNLKTLFAHGGGYACCGAPRFDHGYEVRREARENISMFPSEYLSRMWYDTLVYDYGMLRRLIEVVGIDKVMLGTDFPADMGQVDPVGWLNGSDLSDDERAAVLGDTAASLLGL
ncbi:MAG: aminocarboxymuconate-semialdehyde decarboxylase [Verrucomicrobiales bacterium]|jgi:aminocarboxymuconate-semialdehyde decarboxylase